MPNDFFSLVNGASRFWLPAVLHEIAKIPTSLCRGDGCSIFLLWGEGAERRLHLAATTRPEKLSELFDKRVSYAVDPAALRSAADLWRSQDGLISKDASLTGWVAAFKCPLICNDLHDPRALDRMEGPDRPRPVWSEKSRGPQDHDSTIARPFLCVPMLAGAEVIGAIRVATTTRHPHVFDHNDQARLQQFANSLAAFLIDCGALAREGLSHAFRIWGAEDIDALGSRITEAVPILFDVECCSFFLRDPSRRFVLRTAGTRHIDDDVFRRFLELNRGRLYYEKGDGSKTSVCIDRQAPIVLVRAPDSRWRIDFDGDTQPKIPLNAKSGGQYTEGPVPDVTCEFPHEHTRSILLVPVRDHLSTHLPAGVLRILSTKTIADPQTVITDVLSFAEDLAGVIGRTWRDDQQRRAHDALVTELSSQHLGDDQKIATAARIVCNAVDAGAVSIFVREARGAGHLLKTKPEYSVLSDQYQDDEDFLGHHEKFRKNLPACDVHANVGRTAWVGRHGKTLNLKKLDDAAELARFGIHSEPGGVCEIPNAGPFLAVPITIGPKAKVEGVIRAVRRKDSVDGSFSLAHEEILATCGNVLATLLAASRWKAVVSFCTRPPETDRKTNALDVVKRWVELAGGVVLTNTDRVDGNPMRAFWDLCQKADIGIVIATIDDEELVSDAVEAENLLMWGIERLRTKRIVLEMHGVQYRRQDLNDEATIVEYPRTSAGIHQAQERFHDALRRLLGDAVNR